MTKGLIRYQQNGDFHFVTFSCLGLRPFLGSPSARTLFEQTLEHMRIRYHFRVIAYVVMPEHVHLLITEPASCLLAKAVHALKLSVSKQSSQHPFWQPRYYDFNVYSESKRIEKLTYIHLNPVRRGLVIKPEQWKWSSFLHHATGATGTVEIESRWTASAREAYSNPEPAPPSPPGAPPSPQPHRG